MLLNNNSSISRVLIYPACPIPSVHSLLFKYIPCSYLSRVTDTGFFREWSIQIHPMFLFIQRINALHNYIIFYIPHISRSFFIFSRLSLSLFPFIIYGQKFLHLQQIPAYYPSLRLVIYDA